MGGDHADGSPVRAGNDFYLTHSSFDYAPGLLIYHSRDIINWKPVAAAFGKYHGTVWAPYPCHYQDRFCIYFPAAGHIMVVHADQPTGPLQQIEHSFGWKTFSTPLKVSGGAANMEGE